jgi:hypothetical protein
MVGTAKRGKELNDGKEFSATQPRVPGFFTFRRFLEDCYSENRRRMGVFDKVAPTSCPSWRAALGAMRLWASAPNAACNEWAPRSGSLSRCWPA